MNRTPSKIRARDGPIMLDWFKLYQHAVSLRDGETISFSSYYLLATKKSHRLAVTNDNKKHPRKINMVNYIRPQYIHIVS